MTWDWQDVVALAAVVVAAAYVVRRFSPWPFRRSGGGCASGCAGCSLSQRAGNLGVEPPRPVQIGGLPGPRRP